MTPLCKCSQIPVFKLIQISGIFPAGTELATARHTRKEPHETQLRILGDGYDDR